MSTDSASLDPLDPMTPQPRRERMTTTLIFAVLIHGLVLLGVGFVALVPEHPSGTTVNVTVATSRAAQAPKDAHYLARFNQFGPGNTHVRVPERPRAAAAPSFAEPRFRLARRLSETLANPALEKTFAKFDASHADDERELITTTSDSRRVTSQVSEAPAPMPRAISVKLAAPNAAQRNKLEFGAVELPQLYGKHPEAHARTTNARQALYAPYLLEWQRRVEQVGTQQFAQLVPGHIKKGHLTLSVTLGSDGSVRSLSIIKRSAHPELDAAALKIIRLAAPFAPFSSELRARSKTLTFTYRWNFIRHGGKGSLGLGG